MPFRLFSAEFPVRSHLLRLLPIVNEKVFIFRGMESPSNLKLIVKPLINGLIEQVDILRRLSIGYAISIIFFFILEECKIVSRGFVAGTFLLSKRFMFLQSKYVCMLINVLIALNCKFGCYKMWKHSLILRRHSHSTAYDKRKCNRQIA